MKDSIGQAFIVNLIIVFFGILILLFFGSINYSKAFKSKNKIITVIEKYGKFDNSATEEIKSDLAISGYRINLDVDSLRNECKKICEKQYESSNDCKYSPENPGTKVFLTYPSETATGSAYDYCVFQITTDLGSRYQVVSFMQVELPIVGGLFRFPVKGETKVLYDTIKDF